MDTNPKPDPTTPLPQYPGSGQPRVQQPGQFVPTVPGQPPIKPTAQIAPPPGNPKARAIQATEYVDPILFTTGFFRDKADFDQTVRLAVAKIRSGLIQPRSPDVDEKS